MAPKIDLTHCTLTGVDRWTDIDRLIALSRAHPVAEWGLLWSSKRQGEPGRYPSSNAIKGLLERLPAEVRVAVHYCGSAVHELIEGEALSSSIADLVAARAGRIQLNFNMQRTPIDVDQLRGLFARLPQVTFITQQNKANATLWQYLQGQPNHAVLFDESGGRGAESAELPSPLPLATQGYAGGFGPGNIAGHLTSLAGMLDGRSVWVDMESSLRTTDAAFGDMLDLSTCETVLKVAQSFVPERPRVVATPQRPAL